MRYAVARIEQENRDAVYRIYITDCLKAICGAKIRYADLIRKDNGTTEQNSEAIKDRLKKKLGGLNESARPTD